MSNDFDHFQHESDVRNNDVAALNYASSRNTVRKRSATYIGGLPLYDVALGPDPDRNETRGHARGIIAVGDIATGFLAMGGVARGIIAFGGVAFGVITFGGCSIAILVGIGGLGVGALAIGGLAIGLIALGGGAVGLIAVGGGACGYYACGGGAFGQHVISGMEQDPEAIRFFGQWIPGIDKMAQPPAR